MQIIKAAATYFTLTFAAGFVLGTIRVLWVVPAFGTRTAELAETPIMIIVSALGARWAIRRLGVSPTPSRRMAVGLIALALLLAAEFTLVVWVRGLPIREYLADRDPVAGTAYLIALLVFAVLPLLVARK